MKKIITALLGMVLVNNYALADATGRYVINLETPFGEQLTTLSINSDGTGFIENDMMGKKEFSEAELVGESFKFNIHIDMVFSQMEIRWAGTVDGDVVKGDMTGPKGKTEFIGEREKDL